MMLECDAEAVEAWIQGSFRETRRVVGTGGVVAVRDADFHATTWLPSSPALIEWMELYQQIARGNHAEPDGGRHLLSWVQEAGLTGTEVSASSWVYATDENCDGEALNRVQVDCRASRHRVATRFKYDFANEPSDRRGAWRH